LCDAFGKPHLKTATLLVNIPSSHVVLSALVEAPTIIKVSGNSGTRIVFSCTWKEKRKNEIEEVSIERSKRGKRGPGSIVDTPFPEPSSPSTIVAFNSFSVDGDVSATIETSFSAEVAGVAEVTGSSLILKLNPVLNKPTTAGTNPAAVKNVESLTRVPELAKLRHLRTTLEKHQKFATLSSKRPREKGKILLMGSRIAIGEENGGRNGKKRRANDATVTAPSCRNSLPLHGIYFMMRRSVEGRQRERNVPVLLTEIDALGEQVRSDSRCVIQRHLLEAETCDEKNRSDEVLALGHVVDAKKRQTCYRRAVSHGTIEATNQTNPT
jgi:hypothetical protein